MRWEWKGGAPRGGRGGEVVDGHQVEPVGIKQDLQRRPADPAQAVYGHSRQVTSQV
jgi:hypothetical protein